jgi:hypothetical protein
MRRKYQWGKTIMAIYQGVVKHGRVVLPDYVQFKEGTTVMVKEQVDLENEWLAIPQVDDRFGVSTELIKQWIKSAKVRVYPLDSKLVNAGDVEDAIEQLELFMLSSQVIEREE